MTAVDEDDIPVGHFIIRFIHGDRRLLRFGWVIVDDRKRGEKIGQQMLKLGLRCAFEIIGAKQVTIGVFENNTAALKCYLSVGFHQPSEIPDSYEEVGNETWKIAELAVKKEEFL